jgi:hypothetical protein
LRSESKNSTTRGSRRLGGWDKLERPLARGGEAVGPVSTTRWSRFDRKGAAAHNPPNARFGQFAWSAYGAKRAHPVAAIGKRSMPGNPANKPKPLPWGYHQLPIAAHDKEGVDGSSPSEGFRESGRLEVGGDLHDLVVGAADGRSLIAGAGSPCRPGRGHFCRRTFPGMASTAAHSWDMRSRPAPFVPEPFSTPVFAGLEKKRGTRDSCSPQPATRVRYPAHRRWPSSLHRGEWVQSDCPPGLIGGQSAGHQSPCGSVVCPTSMM